MIIRRNTCSTCALKDSAPGGLMICRRFPPQMHPIVVITPKGPQIVGRAALWAEVGPDHWCGEYRGVVATTHPSPQHRDSESLNG